MLPFFILEEKEETNLATTINKGQSIKFKTGLESNIPSTIDPGQVFFTVDEYKKIGKIFVDIEENKNGTVKSYRANIVPDVMDCGTWTIVDLGYKDPTCCFVAGSLILCADESTKPIEQVSSGDIVMSYNIFTKQFYPVVVQKLIVNPNTTHMALVLLDDGTQLEMNAYHPVYTEDGFHSLTNHEGYDTLVIGDRVCGFDGYHTIVDIIETHLSEPITTYNLAIKDMTESIDDDTYDTFIVNNCVVHNAACPT
jgi:hypothetical protein